MSNNKDKQSDLFSKVIIIFCVLVSIALLMSVLYVLGIFGENKFSNYIEEEIPYSGKYIEKNNNHSEISKEQEQELEEDNIKVSSELGKLINLNNVSKFYKGTLHDSKADEDAAEELLLYKDGTYFKSSCYFTCKATSGTYTIDNNKISLVETRLYGIDNCYNTSNSMLDLVYKNKAVYVTSNAGKVELVETDINEIENILTYYYEEQSICESEDADE